MPHYAVRASSTCVSENNEGLRSTNLRIEIGSRKRAELRRKLGLTARGMVTILRGSYSGTIGAGREDMSRIGLEKCKRVCQGRRSERRRSVSATD